MAKVRIGAAVVVVIGSLLWVVGSVNAQTELLDIGQDGISVSGGATHYGDSKSFLTTEVVSLSLQGRMEFSVKFTQMLDGVRFTSTAVALHWWKPKDNFPFGAAFLVAFDSSGSVDFYGGSIYWRTEAPGRDQFVFKTAVGVARELRLFRRYTFDEIVPERFIRANSFSFSLGLIAASQLTRGIRATISPKYQWQKSIGSIIGLEVGFLRFYPDTDAK